MKYVIIGAGDQVKNVLNLFKIDVAFIFDTPREPGEKKEGVPVFDIIPPSHVGTELRWIAPVRDPRHKRELVHKVLNETGPFPVDFGNLTHPSAVVAKNVTRSCGIYVQPFATIYAHAWIGAHSTILGRASIGHDCEIGIHSTIGHHAFLGGHVTLEQGVEVGAGARIREGLRIGEGAMIGMGAVVTHDVPPNEVWIGVPAKPMKARIFVAGTYRYDQLPNMKLEAWR